MKSNEYEEKKVQGLVFATNRNKRQSATFSEYESHIQITVLNHLSSRGQQSDPGCPSWRLQAWLLVIRWYWTYTVALQIQTHESVGYQLQLSYAKLPPCDWLTVIACLKIAFQDDMVFSVNYYLKNIKHIIPFRL